MSERGYTLYPLLRPVSVPKSRLTEQWREEVHGLHNGCIEGSNCT